MIEGRFDDAMLPVLKMEEGTISQSLQAASRSWKSQKNGFSLAPLEGTQP